MPLASIGKLVLGNWEKRIPRRCRINRDEAILNLCGGKKVLHIGAVDAPFHVDKSSRNELLHQKLETVAASVVGIDSDAEGVQWLRESFGIDNIIVGDATVPTMLGSNAVTFDVIVCCDVIEHVTNAHGLFALCRRHMNPDSVLVITTINATGLKAAVRALFGREAVHYDHVAYFSYGTLCQLLSKVGFVAAQFGAFSYPMSVPGLGPLFEVLLGIAPGVADGILVTARLASADSRP